MSQEKSALHEDQFEMHRRRITLPDGRYLIFYTFGDEDDTRPDDSSTQNQKDETVKAGEEDV